MEVIRTNIVDSGLGTTVFKIFKKEDEDRNVTNAALSAVCNIVIEFSPLQPVNLVHYSCFRVSLNQVDFPGLYRGRSSGTFSSATQHSGS